MSELRKAFMLNVALLIVTGSLALYCHAADKEWLFFNVLTGDSSPRAGEVWLRPMMSPALNFKLVEGDAPRSGSIRCKDVLESRTTGEHSYKVVTLVCEGGAKLELQGVDFAH